MEPIVELAWTQRLGKSGHVYEYAKEIRQERQEESVAFKTIHRRKRVVFADQQVVHKRLCTNETAGHVQDGAENTKGRTTPSGEERPNDTSAIGQGQKG